jgi:hypothetical protein
VIAPTLSSVKAFIRFVEEPDLSIPKIASLMGVFSATLSMWIAGTTKPSRMELLAIKSFLNGAIEVFRAGVVIRCQNRKISIVVIAHVRTIQTNHGGGRACWPVSYPDTTTTGSADQLEHRSHSGCARIANMRSPATPTRGARSSTGPKSKNIERELMPTSNRRIS